MDEGVFRIPTNKERQNIPIPTFPLAEISLSATTTGNWLTH
jgi:hypothetical protein